MCFLLIRSFEGSVDIHTARTDRAIYHFYRLNKVFRWHTLEHGPLRFQQRGGAHRTVSRGDLEYFPNKQRGSARHPKSANRVGDP